MKRLSRLLLAVAVVCAFGVTSHADVKTQQKTKVTFEGMLGRMAGMFGGKFDARYAAKFEGLMAAGASAEQMAAAMVMYPGMKAAMERMQKENVTIEGTALASTMVMEAVKSPEEMAQAQPAESGGGGLGGMLARKMTKKKDPEPRSKVMTTDHQILSIAASASDADVAIPAGFKEKK